jgi:anti-anti-sigma factor
VEFLTQKYDNILVITVNTPNATAVNAISFSTLLEEAISDQIKKFIIDISCVKYIDSAFLGQTIKYLKKIRNSGGDLKLVACEGCGNHAIRVSFEKTETSDIFSIHDNLTEALRSFSDAIKVNN